MRKAMSKRFNKTIAVVLALVVGLETAAVGAVAFAATEFVDIYAYENCVQGMAEFMTDNNRTFQEFLDAHFKSEKLNSELVDAAIDGYKELRKAAYSELGRYKAGVAETSTQVEQLDACIRLTESQVLQAKEMLKNHVRTTTLFKSSSILLDKYKSINSKLADLNFLISQIVAAFAMFNNKIICYIDNCLTSD